MLLQDTSHLEVPWGISLCQDNCRLSLLAEANKVSRRFPQEFKAHSVEKHDFNVMMLRLALVSDSTE
tara:strand:+ start:1836 stop:2036 length:201 start_codon:yes stop_codon:yes gene_type:complete